MLTQQNPEKLPLNYANEYYNLEAKGPMLDRVYSMRYRSYSEKDYIDRCTSEKFMDEYDSQSNCVSYLTYFHNKAIGSIRICLHDPASQVKRLPIMDVFEKEIDELVGYDKKIIEANKLVMDPSFQSKGGVKARMTLYQNIADNILDHNADYLIAGIRPEHIKFYKMLKFKPVTDEKSYPHLKFKTLLVVCEDVMGFVDKVYSKKRKPARSKESVNGSLLSYGLN